MRDRKHTDDVKVIRDIRKKIKKAIKFFNKNGVSAYISDRYTDSNQYLAHYATEALNIEGSIVDEPSYIMINKIREGRSTMPKNHINVYWKGDMNQLIEVFKDFGLTVRVPESTNVTIQIIIK